MARTWNTCRSTRISSMYWAPSTTTRKRCSSCPSSTSLHRRLRPSVRWERTQSPSRSPTELWRRTPVSRSNSPRSGNPVPWASTIRKCRHRKTKEQIRSWTLRSSRQRPPTSWVTRESFSWMRRIMMRLPFELLWNKIAMSRKPSTFLRRLRATKIMYQITSDCKARTRPSRWI